MTFFRFLLLLHFKTRIWFRDKIYKNKRHMKKKTHYHKCERKRTYSYTRYTKKSKYINFVSVMKKIGQTIIKIKKKNIMK